MAGEEVAELVRSVAAVVLEHPVVLAVQARVRGHAHDGPSSVGEQRHDVVGQERFVVLDVLDDVEQEDEIELALGSFRGPADAFTRWRGEVGRAVVDVPTNDLRGRWQIRESS